MRRKQSLTENSRRFRFFSVLFGVQMIKQEKEMEEKKKRLFKYNPQEKKKFFEIATIQKTLNINWTLLARNAYSTWKCSQLLFLFSGAFSLLTKQQLKILQGAIIAVLIIFSVTSKLYKVVLLCNAGGTIPTMFVMTSTR